MTTNDARTPDAPRTGAVDICLRDQVGRFGVQLPKHCVRQILDYADRDYPNETGGIILGNYAATLDLALVSEVSGPPPDSRKKRWGFIRGILGLQSLIHRLWKQRRYYLGEWHVHPDGPPIPSDTDHTQMRAIAENAEYQCPEPLLLIVGYTKTRDMTLWTAMAYVFPRGKPVIRLSHETQTLEHSS